MPAGPVQGARVLSKVAETLVTSSFVHPKWSDMNSPRPPIFYQFFHDATGLSKLTLFAILPKRYIRALAFK
jgi:hypothetical protein